MKIASIQMAVVEKDKAATLDKAARNIAACAHADVILLPEMWNLGFLSFDRYTEEAEDQNGPTLTMLRDMARSSGSWLHSGSFVEREGKNLFNTSYLITPNGEIAGRYRKIHLFGFNSKETTLLTPGDAVTVVKTPWEIWAWPPVLISGFPSFSGKWWTRAQRCFWFVRLGPIPGWRPGRCSTGSGPWKINVSWSPPMPWA